MTDTAPNWNKPLHYTPDGNRAVCNDPMASALAFDPDDPAVSCTKCRLYLKGYRDGKAAR